MTSFLTRGGVVLVLGPSILVLVLAAACGGGDSIALPALSNSDDGGTVLADVGNAPAEDGHSAVLVDAAAEDARPADGALEAGSPPRACGLALATALPLDRRTTWHPSRPIRLGQAAAGHVLLAGTYAAGAPVRSIGGVGATLSSLGADVANPMGTIEWLAPPRVGVDVVFDNLEGGTETEPAMSKDELDGPTPLRITYAVVWAQEGDSWMLGQELTTPQTPDAGFFVRSLDATHFFGFTLSVEFSSACARLAVEDVLGGMAVLSHLPGGDPSVTLLDPALRPSLERLLVRDGAKMRASVVSNQPRAAVKSILDLSACSSANLEACADLIAAMHAQSTAIETTAPAHPAYETLESALDAEWSVTMYSVGPVLQLRPAP